MKWQKKIIYTRQNVENFDTRQKITNKNFRFLHLFFFVQVIWICYCASVVFVRKMNWMQLRSQHDHTHSACIWIQTVIRTVNIPFSYATHIPIWFTDGIETNGVNEHCITKWDFWKIVRQWYFQWWCIHSE